MRPERCYNEGMKQEKSNADWKREKSEASKESQKNLWKMIEKSKKKA